MNIPGTEVIRKEKDVDLLRRVESYLRRSGTAPTRFGRDAVRDPQFVFDLRRGRECGAGMIRRVSAYIEARERRIGR